MFNHTETLAGKLKYRTCMEKSLIIIHCSSPCHLSPLEKGIKKERKRRKIAVTKNHKKIHTNLTPKY